MAHTEAAIWAKSNGSVIMEDNSVELEKLQTEPLWTPNTRALMHAGQKYGRTP
jgi:hypothetical protein